MFDCIIIIIIKYLKHANVWYDDVDEEVKIQSPPFGKTKN